MDATQVIDVSIIIVHFNTPLLTQNCLRSIFALIRDVRFEVIVVDNASTVHDAQALASIFPAIKLIKSERNLGFAGGNNLGISNSTGNYILLLNSDTVLLNNAIKLAYDYLVQNSSVGVVSAQLQYPDGKIQSVCQRFPSIKYSLIELLRLQKFLTRKERGAVLLGSFFDHKRTMVVDWVWGTFFMFPRQILNELPAKKLDDRYFMYAEDMQWCFDIKKLGYEIHYYPAAKVMHHMGGSSGNKSSLMHANNRRFLSDNFSSLKAKTIMLLHKLL